MRQGKTYWRAQYEAQLKITESALVSERQLAAHFADELRTARERISELEDSLRARSLAELRAVRPVAMPAYPEDPEERDDWGTDPTGLFRDKLPPLSPEEQRVADQLRS